MNWTSLTSSIIAGAGVLAEVLLDLALERLRERYTPPEDVAAWLRTRAAQQVVEQALLQALADTAAHVDLDELPFFDAALFQAKTVAPILTGLLLPGGDEAATAQALAGAWRDLFPHSQGGDAPIEAVARLFVERFRHALRFYPPLRAMTDSNTLANLATQWASFQADTAPALAAIQEQLDQIRDQLASLLLLTTPGTFVRIQTATTSPSTPEVAWQVEVPGERTPLTGHLGFFGQTPQIVTRPGGADIYLGARDGSLAAYRAQGNQIEVRWRLPLPTKTYAPEALACWKNILVVTPQPESFLDETPAFLLVDREEGQVVGAIPVGLGRMGPASVQGNVAYSVAADGTLVALDLARREVAWTLPQVGAFSPFPPLVVGDRLILPANSPTLTCVDLHARQVLWRFTAQKTPVEAMPHFLSTPVCQGSTVFASNSNGGLYALDLESGALRWSSPYFTAGIIDRSPVLVRDLVLVASRDHRVHAVEQATGALRWRSHDLGRRILSQHVVVGDVVFVGPLRRELYALRLEDGSPVWPDPIPLPDRVRGDLVQAEHLLVVPTRKGFLVGIDLTPFAQAVAPPPERLLEADRWPESVAALVQAEEWIPAAHILRDHGLFYRAARLFEQGGRLREAAETYAQDRDFPVSLRRGANLYRQMGELETAAALLEEAGDWAAAAQTWETAQRFDMAARIYQEKLDERRRAAQLYARAGLAEQAAGLYEELGDLRQAKTVLERTEDPAYRPRIQELLRKLISHGDQDALGKLLSEAHTPAERAQLYAQAGEWIAAAEEWLQAGEWRKAAELLVEHNYVDRALSVLQQRTESEARTWAARLLEEEQRWLEAVALYQALDDLAGQARCYQMQGDYVKAARLYEEAARRQEAPRLSPEAQQKVADLFASAASLYRRMDQQRYIQCRRKVHYYRRWPWLTPRIAPQEKSFFLEASNVLHLELLNEGAGPAYDVELELYNENGWITVSGLQPFGGVGPLVKEEQWVSLVPHRHNDITVRVRLRWTNPNGERKEVELWRPWVITVVDPNQPNPDAPKTVNVYGDLYQAETVIHGNQYRDQAYHQEGDRVDIQRGLRDRLPAVGRRCPSCTHINPVDASFCEACGTALASDRN